MFVGNDKGQVIVVNNVKHIMIHDLHFRPHDDDDRDNDDDCQVLKIVNFAGAKPSDGSSLPSPVLVEELQVSSIIIIMVIVVFKVIFMMLIVVFKIVIIMVIVVFKVIIMVVIVVFKIIIMIVIVVSKWSKWWLQV